MINDKIKAVIETVTAFMDVSDFLNILPTFNHLDGGDGTFVAFVAKHAATTFLCLFEGVAGEQPVDDWYLTHEVQVGQTLRCSLTDVVEMRCVATNDATDGNNSIHLTGIDKTCRTINQLETTGNGLDRDVLFTNTMLDECLTSCFKQSACYLVVPLAYDNTHPHACSIRYGLGVVVG